MKQEGQMLLNVQFDRTFTLATRSNATVLLTGPTGAGKTALARRIHDQSSRRAMPFVTVNLACVHEGTLESELFGHERGSFTGAEQRRTGRLEQAQGGTVFLDEIGEMPLRLQARLLEFLQSKTILPVGGNKETRLDVRIIAATHRNLEKAIKDGTFREDLFHRLRVITIELPSLQERREEFDLIVHQCLAELAARAGRSVLGLSEAVASRLEEHSWPGNFRELRNVLEYAVLAADGPSILPEHLPSWFSASPDADHVRAEAGFGQLGTMEMPLGLDFQSTLAQFEKEYLRRALGRYRGRINLTARRIGMNKTTLIRRIRAHGLLRTYETPQDGSLGAER